MRLLTNELIIRLTQQRSRKDADINSPTTLVIAKFIEPNNGSAYYITDYYAEMAGVGAFCIRNPDDPYPDDWNIFDLTSLDGQNDPETPSYVVRDDSFREGPFTDVLKENRRQWGFETSLITQDLGDRFSELGDQRNVDNPVIVAKFFLHGHTPNWLAMSYDPANRSFFGYVQGNFGELHDEFGTWSLDQLEAFRSQLYNLPIERDWRFKELRFSEIKEIRGRM